jgi:hypothetical protein
MALASFLPPWPLGVLFALLVISRFENQRWTRARAAGLRGASETFGALVDLTGALGLIFGIVFIVAAGFDHGWQVAVGLFVVGFIVSLLYSVISTIIFGGDRVLLWALGTLGVWVFGTWLAFLTTWFGLTS